MENLTVSQLHSTGSELLVDPESFMDELGENNLARVAGGGTPTVISASVVGFSAGLVVSRQVVDWVQQDIRNSRK